MNVKNIHKILIPFTLVKCLTRCALDTAECTTNVTLMHI